MNTVPDGTLESVIVSKMETERGEINITQKLIIRDDNRWFATIYYITSDRVVTNLRFFQGMDWNFGGSYLNDNAYYDPTNDIVYGYDNNAPPDNIQYGGYGSNIASSAHDVNYYLRIWWRIYLNSLSNSNSYEGDAATALAWDFPSLELGEKIVIPIIWGLGYNYTDLVNQINDGKSKLFDVGILSIDTPENNSNFNPSTTGIVYFNATVALFGLVDIDNLEIIFNVTKVGGGYTYQATTHVNLSVPFNETSHIYFPLNISSLPYGKYKVMFKTNLSNDQNTSNDIKWIYFNLVAFTIGPDQQNTSDQGTEVFYKLTSENYYVGDIFDVSIINSTKGWVTRLYNGTEIIAEDSDGDGIWDIILNDTNSNGLPDIFLPLGVSYVNVSKVIPATAPLGETDLTVLNFSNGVVGDTVKIYTSTPQPPTEQKEFYLHPDLILNTSKQLQSSVTKIESQSIESWYQSPPFAAEFEIFGKIYVNLWLNSSTDGQHQISITIIKTDGVTSEVIGTNSTQLSLTTTPSLYVLTIPLMSPVTFTRGDYFVLRIDNLEARDIYIFQSPDYSSNVTFNTTTYIKVVEAYNSDCYAGDPFMIFANITDPIGSFDINSTVIQISYENGTLAETGVMNLNSTDPSPLPVWKLFDYTTTLSEGRYTINITTIERNGVIYTTIYNLTCVEMPEPHNLTAKIEVNSSKISISIYSAEDVTDISVYWIKPANISITGITGDFDSSSSSGDVYWWHFNTISGGMVKHVYVSIAGTGEYSLLQVMNVGIDPG